jgi:hypothetical protein
MPKPKTILELIIAALFNPADNFGATHEIYKLSREGGDVFKPFGLRIHTPFIETEKGSINRFAPTIPKTISDEAHTALNKRTLLDKLSETTSLQTTYYGPYGIPSQPLLEHKDLDLQIIPWIEGPSLREMFFDEKTGLGAATWEKLAAIEQKEYIELFIQLRNWRQDGKVADLQHSGNIMANPNAKELPVFNLVDNSSNNQPEKARQRNTPESLIRLFFPSVAGHGAYSKEQQIVLDKLVIAASQTGMNAAHTKNAIDRLAVDYMHKDSSETLTTLTNSQRIITGIVLNHIMPYVAQTEDNIRPTELPLITLGQSVDDLLGLLKLAQKQRQEQRRNGCL